MFLTCICLSVENTLPLIDNYHHCLSERHISVNCLPQPREEVCRDQWELVLVVWVDTGDFYSVVIWYR